MDFYLHTENAYQRLLKEYKEHQALVVAFDFDNTVYDYHKNGWKFNNVIFLLQKLKAINCYLIVFTANEDIEFVKKHCIDNQIPFDAINQHPPFYKSESRKIYYNILLDDRAGLKTSFDLLTRLLKEVSKNINNN